jgi:DNA modification methylase
VYDPFGGSGSTLVACEQTKRKCLMVELDPEYCQVIIDRFKKVTGQNAERINNLEK